MPQGELHALLFDALLIVAILALIYFTSKLPPHKPSDTTIEIERWELMQQRESRRHIENSKAPGITEIRPTPPSKEV